MYVGMQYTYVCHDLIVYLGRRNHSYQLSFFSIGIWSIIHSVSPKLAHD